MLCSWSVAKLWKLASLFFTHSSKFMPLTDDLNGTAKELLTRQCRKFCEEQQQ